jgi:multimeric flavodoxin WrbA
MSLRALFLNCSLKPSPKASSTQALIAKVEEQLKLLDVATDTVRVIDRKVAIGTAMDEGHGDGWPALLDEIRAADILIVATPIWLGERSSVAKIVAERLDATTYQLDGRNQHELYGKVGGAIAVGESDGAQAALKSMLYDMTIAGLSVPPNADVYWNNEAGLGGAYVHSEGDTCYFVNERARWMAHNLVHLAHTLKANPYPTDLDRLQKEAEAISRPKKYLPPRD